MQKSVLITDLDNTLFDWFSVWFASNSAMFDSVCEKSGIPKTTLLEEIKVIHQKYGTAEYSYLLEELPSLLEVYGDRDTIRVEMNDAVHAFRSARKKHLHLYDTVEDTLKKLKEIGVLIIVYTESRSYHSSFRIKRLGLDKYIDILYSPEDHDVPKGETVTNDFGLDNVKHIHTPKDELKPNPQLLLDIVERSKASIEQCVYIGDSEMKDIDMAQKAHISDVFALYGTEHFKSNPEDYDLLRAVTHWTEQDVAREKEIKEKFTNIAPSNTVNKFSEILDLFEFVSFNSR
ncbi:HAD family hydrolase [Photobacterium carnosum]|uniref:HAD family hydrolase n=1 Tax=Photobacterium carnosum TaxID=2023717 RepID=UPI001E3590A8|nr:HAD hydrolase-like protein [Photobacterium carnosum]MCD9528441.1 HAD hydrolase-like protein [Photobacterium carnosum]